MNAYLRDKASIAIRNDNSRRVLCTARNRQFVVMSLKPKKDIGAEVHELDQFSRVEQVQGEAVLDGVVHHTRADAEADIAHFDGKTSEQP